jgi:arylsulfatase A-like enzyme/tetratricopeptide (TPR) repeat protein
MPLRSVRPAFVLLLTLGRVLLRPGAAPSDLVLAQPKAATSRPNILLVTLDTTRADRMGFLGSTRGLTPSLDAFARESVVFTNAFAQAPITTVSHATILTGTYPPFHGVTDFGAPLAPTVPYLPDLLKRAGYRTAAFVGSLVLDPRNGTAPGFDRGFDRYDAGFQVRHPGQDRYRTVERRGDQVAARALAWMNQSNQSNESNQSSESARPWFAWVHLYDPHDPYDPPADLKARFQAAPYDGEIAGVDRVVDRLLKAAGPAATIAVAADHGEALGDHGEETHGVFLYDAVLHVPLVVRLPDKRGAGTRLSARVRLADLAPTLLEAVHVQVPSSMQGESLLPLVGGGNATRERPAFAQTDYPRQAFGWSPLVAWRADRFLLVRAPRPELYDLGSDPGAMRNIADSRGRIVQGMSGELDRFLTQIGTTSGGTTSGVKSPAVDPDLARRLAALGYVSGSDEATAKSAEVDPKDRIAIANTLRSAVVAVEDGAFQKAIPLLERVTASEPDIPLAQLELGMAYARQRQYGRAAPKLKRAVALQPENMFAHYELAVSLYETGDLRPAAAEFEIVAARMPRWADARFSLGSVYARIDRVPEALGELRAAIDLEPRHFRANLLLGRILTLQNQSEAAIPHLRAAVQADPSSAEAHSFLADAYEKAGDSVDAARERDRAKGLAKKPGP